MYEQIYQLINGVKNPDMGQVAEVLGLSEDELGLTQALEDLGFKWCFQCETWQDAKFVQNLWCNGCMEIFRAKHPLIVESLCECKRPCAPCKEGRRSYLNLASDDPFEFER